MGNLYRKKPVFIEAIQWTGDNWLEVCKFAKTKHIYIDERGLFVEKLQGEIVFDPGDWVIRDVEGALSSCKPDVFAQVYEKVDE